MAALAGLVVVAGIVATGCGSQAPTAASTQNAAFAVGLQRVDDALAGHRYAAGRRALHTLITETLASEKAGDLSVADGKRIRAAARRLIAELPEPSAASTEASSPAPATHSPSTTRTPKAPATHPTPRPTPSDKPSSSPSGPPSSAGPSDGPSSSQSPDARASNVADSTVASDPG